MCEVYGTYWRSIGAVRPRPFLFYMYVCRYSVSYKNGKRVYLVPHANRHGLPVFS